MKKTLKLFIWLLSLFFVVLLVVFCYFFIGPTEAKKNITWGVDFSQSQAEYMSLDWKELYLAIINDLGAKNIKLHTNWDWVEGKKDNFYFDDVDWQIKQAEQKNVKVIYVVGMKTGRWPECHTPGWAEYASEKEVKAGLLKYIETVVNRYKGSKAITFWQVENEPLFRFGECPSWYYNSSELLKSEVELVKSLDPSRQVIISDSGEQSSWFEAAKIGDIVGITMYRNVWAHITDTFGFHAYSFLNPVTYMRKAQIVKQMFGKEVICIELQAEPWAGEPLMNAPMEEQLKSMNPEMFQEDVQFAMETGLNKFYFWGVEWWYWMKVKNNQPQIWNEAKLIFQN